MFVSTLHASYCTVTSGLQSVPLVNYSAARRFCTSFYILTVCNSPTVRSKCLHVPRQTPDMCNICQGSILRASTVVINIVSLAHNCSSHCRRAFAVRLHRIEVSFFWSIDVKRDKNATDGSADS